MSSIMVLGAGVMQVPLIRKIKEMGHTAVVVGSAGAFPGIPLADRIHFQDFTDAVAVERIAREEGIAGICTCGLDLPVRTLAYVCEALKLPGLPAEAGRIVTDKKLMKDCFVRHGVRTARHLEASTLEDGYRAFDELIHPVMFKAVDSQGSTGIIKVETRGQIAHAYDCVRKATRLEHFIVEEFIEGQEIGAQAFVVNGKVQFVLPHGDYVYTGDAGVPIGHYVPANLGDQVQRGCEDQLQKCVEAANLHTCAINADFILKDGDIYVLEIGARCGATMLAETVSIFLGIDYYEQIVRACLGEPTDFKPRPGGMPNATMTLYSEKDGIIASIRNDNSLDPNIVEIAFDQQAGSRVRKFRLGKDRLGHVIVKGETLQVAQSLLARALASIHIEVV